MKFRTDFVTNSSDSSFLTFNIKNKKLLSALENLGIQIEVNEEGAFTEWMTVTLPSGEQASIDSGENWFYPVPTSFNSISAWLVGCILWEVEDLWPQKAADEYSAFAKELIQIFNEANITHLDWEAVSEWSRDDVYADLDKAFGPCETDLEEAFVEYTYGFEGEVGPNEVVEVKNGRKVTYTYESDDEEGPIPADDVRFVLVGKFERFETREEFVEKIEELGGIVSSSVSKNTDFVICNDSESTAKAIEKAKELSIPIISEVAFINKFDDPEEYEDMPDFDDIIEELWDTTYGGGFKEKFEEYGLGNVSVEVFKKGRWVSKN